MPPKYIREPARETPLLFDTDVLIAGGGPAGILAAISASKNGVRTALIEENSFLGGMAAIGLGMPINNTAPGGIEHGGLTSDFVRLLCQPGPDEALVNETRIWGKHIWHDPELLKTKALQFLMECGVKVILNARVVGGIVEGNIARGIILEAKGGRKAILSKVLIDCTGDADASAYLGVEFEMSSKKKLQSANINFVLADVDRQKSDCFFGADYEGGAAWEMDILSSHDFVFKQTEWENLIRKARSCGMLADVPEGVRIWWYGHALRPRTVIFNAVRVGGYNWLDTEDLTTALFLVRKQMHNIVDFLRRFVPGFENSYIQQSSPRLGVRETRRIIGEYVLNYKDVTNFRKFPDGVVRCDNPFDNVFPGGERIPLRTLPVGEWFHIPYCSLVPKNTEGLLVAGRCISTTHEVQTAIRGMGTCMAMGEVTGLAASLAIKMEISPRMVPVEHLMDQLKKQGMTPNG
jgi:hypothetical protein